MTRKLTSAISLVVTTRILEEEMKSCQKLLHLIESGTKRVKRKTTTITKNIAMNVVMKVTILARIIVKTVTILRVESTRTRVRIKLSSWREGPSDDITTTLISNLS